MKAARVALSNIVATNSVLLSSSFIEDVQQLQTLFPDHPEVKALAGETVLAKVTSTDWGITGKRPLFL